MMTALLIGYVVISLAILVWLGISVKAKIHTYPKKLLKRDLPKMILTMVIFSAAWPVLLLVIVYTCIFWAIAILVERLVNYGR